MSRLYTTPVDNKISMMSETMPVDRTGMLIKCTGYKRLTLFSSSCFVFVVVAVCLLCV